VAPGGQTGARPASKPRQRRAPSRQGGAAPKLDAERLPVRNRRGIRWRYSYPDSRGRAQQAPLSERARRSARPRASRRPQARRRLLRQPAALGPVLTSLATGARPIWWRAPGLTTRCKAASGRCRISAQRRPDDDHHVRGALLLPELVAGEWAPKTVNNALGVLVAVLNGAVAEPSWRSTGARGRAPAARPHRARLARPARRRPLPRGDVALQAADGLRLAFCLWRCAVGRRAAGQ
jgi:hypothetical protein